MGEDKEDKEDKEKREKNMTTPARQPRPRTARTTSPRMVTALMTPRARGGSSLSFLGSSVTPTRRRAMASAKKTPVTRSASKPQHTSSLSSLALLTRPVMALDDDAILSTRTCSGRATIKPLNFWECERIIPINDDTGTSAIIVRGNVENAEYRMVSPHNKRSKKKATKAATKTSTKSAKRQPKRQLQRHPRKHPSRHQTK